MYEKQKKDGKISECLFADKMKKLNIEVEDSLIYENKYLHYDFKTKKNDKIVLVDVKGLKHKKRYDDEYTTDILIEFVGISGKAGWLYGKADYIAFQLLDNKLNDNFLIVSRIKLMETVTKEIFTRDLTVYENDDEIINYNLYNRKKRLDLFAWFPLEIIKKINGVEII